MIPIKIIFQDVDIKSLYFDMLIYNEHFSMNLDIWGLGFHSKFQKVKTEDFLFVDFFLGQFCIWDKQVREEFFHTFLNLGLVKIMRKNV